MPSAFVSKLRWRRGDGSRMVWDEDGNIRTAQGRGGEWSITKGPFTREQVIDRVESEGGWKPTWNRKEGQTTVVKRKWSGTRGERKPRPSRKKEKPAGKASGMSELEQRVQAEVQRLRDNGVIRNH